MQATQPLQKPLQTRPEITPTKLPTYLLPCLRASLLPVFTAAAAAAAAACVSLKRVCPPLSCSGQLWRSVGLQMTISHPTNPPHSRSCPRDSQLESLRMDCMVCDGRAQMWEGIRHINEKSFLIFLLCLHPGCSDTRCKFCGSVALIVHPCWTVRSPIAYVWRTGPFTAYNTANTMQFKNKNGKN